MTEICKQRKGRITSSHLSVRPSTNPSIIMPARLSQHSGLELVIRPTHTQTLGRIVDLDAPSGLDNSSLLNRCRVVSHDTLLFPDG
jgi:hypothetical protein